MAVILNKANLVLKDANGNIGKIEQLSNRDLAKIKTAVSDVSLVVNQSNHKPIVATTTNKGVVQLATSSDVASGAIDKVVTAEQLHNATTGTNLARTVNGIKPDANGNIAITSVANADTATRLKGYDNHNSIYLGWNGSNLTMNVDSVDSTKGVVITHLNISSQSVKYATSAGSATKATQDASGNNIVNTYATKSSLSSAQTTLQNKINLVIQRIDKHEGSSAGSANARYLEKDMTDYFNTGALSTAIANNNFSELSVGNFITKNVVVNGTTYSNVKFYLAHFDYYYHFGNSATTEITKHHVLIIPEHILGKAVMNDTNTTEGGYLNSKMHKTTLPLYNAGYRSAFGSAHILVWNNFITNHVDKTVGSSGYIAHLGASDHTELADAVCELMSESMVYGAPIWSSSGFDIGSLHQQLALFRFNTSAILAGRNWHWLRNVHSSSHFCANDGNGNAAYTSATELGGVRPFALLI